MPDKADVRHSKIFRLLQRLKHEGIVDNAFLKMYKEVMTPVMETILRKRNAPPDDEEYWTDIRHLFAFDDVENVIPINASNLTPTFDVVTRVMNEFNLRLNLDVSMQKRINVFSLVIDSARDLIATQLGVPSKDLALMRNGTEANCAINNGIALKEGDEIVIWEQNHGTNYQAWEIRKQRVNFTITVVPSDLEGATNTVDVVAQFVSRCNANTKVLTFSHVSNISGVLLPAKEICEGVHAAFPDIHVHVDGAQTWGTMPINLNDMGCDSFAASAHKFFLGPKETGILYMKESRVPNFQPNIFGYDGKIELPDELYPDASRFETLGQRPDPSLMALLLTAYLFDMIGIEAINSRLAYLGTRMYDGFSSLDLPMTTPSDPSRRLSVIVAAIDPAVGVDLYNYLYEEWNIGVASTGGIRISPTIPNTAEHIDMVIEATREFLSLPAETRTNKGKKKPKK